MILMPQPLDTLRDAKLRLLHADHVPLALARGRAAWIDVTAVADRKRGVFARAMVDAAVAARAVLDLAALEVAYRERDTTRMEFVLGASASALYEALRRAYADATLATLQAAGVAAARHARDRGGFRVSASASPAVAPIRFDLVNPRAVAWASTRSATLVTRVSASTRKAIRGVVADSFSMGIPADRVGRMIRPLIGLTPAQAAAVQSFTAAMRDNPGGKVWAGSMAVRVPKEGADLDFLERRSERYADRLLNLRADTIARTETIAAANEGQRELWLQARDKGLLRGDENREWIATPDERVCPECEDLDGEVAPLTGPFSNNVMSPPAHPDCRCAVGLTREPVTED